jgi:hypothetical protein
MAKQERKRVDEVLLRERLGLDDDWLNRDADGTARLPRTSPRFIKDGHSEREIASLESAIDRLAAAGCRREAVYFCLRELSPAAERSRRGQEWVSAPGPKVGDPEILQIRSLKLAPKEDLKVVANHAKKALRVIRKHRRELLLAYDVTKPPLPRGLVAGAPDAGEALSLLLKSLAWVRELANSYIAPFETTLLKSKGLLYLTLYVSMYADTERLKSSQRRAHSEEPSARRERRAKRAVLPDHALASVANFCTDGEWAPSELFTKLSGFEKAYPALYAKLKTKMAALHRNATR